MKQFLRPVQLFFISVLSTGLLLAAAPQAAAQTPEQWTEWGERVHGGFGSLIASGIAVGQDALEQLNADRRQLEVDYSDGPATPCPCVIDGIAIATSASVGQKTLRLSPEQTEADLMAKIVFTHRETGDQVTYVIPQAVLPVMQKINQEDRGVERYHSVMAISPNELFQIVD